MRNRIRQQTARSKYLLWYEVLCLTLPTFLISTRSAFAPWSILMIWPPRILGPSALASSAMIPLLITPTWWDTKCWDWSSKMLLPRLRWSGHCTSLRPAAFSPHYRRQSSFWQQKGDKTSQKLLTSNIWLVCKTNTGSCPPPYWPEAASLIFKLRPVSMCHMQGSHIAIWCHMQSKNQSNISDICSGDEN